MKGILFFNFASCELLNHVLLQTRINIALAGHCNENNCALLFVFVSCKRILHMQNLYVLIYSFLLKNINLVILANTQNKKQKTKTKTKQRKTKQNNKQKENKTKHAGDYKCTMLLDLDLFFFRPPASTL